MQEPFILQYKLDNCASNFCDVEGREEKEQQNVRGEEGDRNTKGVEWGGDGEGLMGRERGWAKR